MKKRNLFNLFDILLLNVLLKQTVKTDKYKFEN